MQNMSSIVQPPKYVLGDPKKSKQHSIEHNLYTKSTKHNSIA